ncbi:MAG: hypothetical protein Salg2KO_14300 [Salibacteraceae bacterium]
METPAPLQEAYETQEAIFEWLRQNAHIEPPIAFELSELWDISLDSVYRRMRGEKLMKLNELLQLYHEYDFSLEEVVASSKSRLVFSFQPILEGAFDFLQYLEYIDNMLGSIAACSNRKMYYLANDVPMFHLMNAPALASFKLFFWQKTILGFDAYKNRSFKLGEVNDRVNKLSRSIRDAYFSIPSIEIFSPQTIETSLRQIEYYLMAGHFEDNKTALYLCDEFANLMRHIKVQCELGRKFKAGSEPTNNHSSTYEVYFNEVLYSDTTIMVEADEERLVYLTNNGLNVLRTNAAPYYEHSLQSFRILQRKSVPVSLGSDRERNHTFNVFLNTIDRFKKKLQAQMDAMTV